MLYEGKLIELNGNLQTTAQKAYLSFCEEAYFYGKQPTEIHLNPANAASAPASIEVGVNGSALALPVVGDRMTRENHIFICLPVED